MGSSFFQWDFSIDLFIYVSNISNFLKKIGGEGSCLLQQYVQNAYLDSEHENLLKTKSQNPGGILLHQTQYNYNTIQLHVTQIQLQHDRITCNTNTITISTIR